jgi:amidase
MDFADYLACDASALAQHVARGEVSASELLELALGQQRRVHGSVNAVIRLMEPEARAQIDAGFSGGPFGGVPFLIKDAVQDYAGIPTTYASRSMAGIVPKRHAHVVERYLKSGLVIFGKTNLPEFAIRGVTDPELFGRTSNPWDLTRTPGGSSGGAAAAIASGIVPMAAGNDGGGSLRIPAACCGLFTVRPSRGRVSSGPDIGEVWFGASTEGVLSRSVRDSAMALDVLQGAEPGDPFVIAPPLEPYTQAMLREPGRLRIGFTSVSPIGTEVHPEAVRAVEHAASLLARLGHHVEEAAPQIDGAALAQSYLHMYFGQIPAAMERAKALGARERDLELMNRILVTLGKSVSAAKLTTELNRWNEYSRSLGAFHAKYDFLLTPTLAAPPVTHGTGDPSGFEKSLFGFLHGTGLMGLLARFGLLDSTVQKMATENLRFVPFTQLSNLTGVPSMSVPLHWTADGLPLGVQFVGPFGSEDRLLQLAHQLEQAQPWFDRLPALVRNAERQTANA